MNLLKRLDDYELVSQADFSPTGKYLVIIQKPSVNNNLKVIDISTFEVVLQFHSTTHPSSIWPQIRFSTTEDYIFRISKGQMDIYQMGNLGEKYGTLTSIINFEISEIVSELITETAIICGRVVVDDKKKKKSLVTVYKLSDLSKPVKEMSVSMSDRMIIRISPDKKYALLQSISDDTSATSYYGESTLYHLDLLYGKFSKISLPTGPIHDFQWTPNGSTFVVCAGHHPARTHIYENTSKFLKEVCVSKVSTIRISPDSRILCLAGFGNLNGDIEFYKMSDFSVIGKTKLYCGVNLNWSLDSKFLVGAVLSPRVRVDNEYRVFSYNGEEQVCQKFTGEVYDCDWICQSNTIKYEEFDISVSKIYLEQLKKKKELEKQQQGKNNLNSAMGGLSIGGGNKSKGGIPGLGKK